MLKSYSQAQNLCFFTLCKGELLRIPSIFQEVQVISGVAWITLTGKDIVLTSEEKASLVSNKDFILVSALGDIPLVLAVW